MCTAGEYKDCPCIGGGILHVDQWGPPDWLDTVQKVFAEVGEYVPGSKTPSTDPNCDMDRASDITYKLFRAAPVYGRFCEAVKKAPKSYLVQTVDELGQVIPNRIKRTPPAEPDPRSGNTFDLEWSGGDGSCASGCIESFDAMTKSPCGHIGGEQNNIAQSIEFSTGCGAYSVKVNVPPGDKAKTPSVRNIQEKPIVCKRFDSDLYGYCFQDIHEETVNSTIDAFGFKFGNKEQKKKDSKMRDMYQVYREKGGTSGPAYVTSVHWIEGCNKYDKQAIDNPKGESGDSSISFGNILWSVFRECKYLNFLLFAQFPYPQRVLRRTVPH